MEIIANWRAESLLLSKRSKAPSDLVTQSYFLCVLWMWRIPWKSLTHCRKWHFCWVLHVMQGWGFSRVLKFWRTNGLWLSEASLSLGYCKTLGKPECFQCDFVALAVLVGRVGTDSKTEDVEYWLMNKNTLLRVKTLQSSRLKCLFFGTQGIFQDFHILFSYFFLSFSPGKPERTKHL